MWRNVVLSIVLCLGLASPVLLYCAEELGFSLPSWLTVEDAYYLEGGKTWPKVADNATLAGFKSGKFQSELEKEIGNHIPCKAMALLGNAGLQRCAISASNAIFNWPVYPAFYGSEYVVSPDEGRMLEMAEKATEDSFTLGEEVADRIDEFSTEWSGKHFFIYMGASSSFVEGSPTSKLVSQPLSYEQIEDVFEACDGNFTWVSGNVSYSEFKDLWYKSDHHWTVRGAYQAYLQISDAMGFGGEALVPSEIVELDDPLFYGTFARRALNDDYSDRLAYFKFEDYPELTVEVDGEQGGFEGLINHEAYEAGEFNANKFANHYGEFYHWDHGFFSITNPSAETESELLIVSDSYSNCLEYLLAPHFRTVYVCDPRNTEMKVREMLEEHPGVTDVLFLMRKADLVSKDTLDALE